MLLEEANNYLKKSITEEQLEKIHEIYCLLDFDKADFCELVDCIGIEKWTNNHAIFRRLAKAERELTAKERYLSAQARLEELESEREQLVSIVDSYNPWK